MEASQDSFQSQSSKVPRNLALGLGFVPRLFHRSWWRLLLRTLLTYKQVLLKPSIALSLALTLPYLVLDIESRVLNTRSTYYGLMDVVSTIGFALVIMGGISIFCLALTIYGFAKLLIALTALCRTFLSIEPEEVPANETDLATLLEISRDQSLNLLAAKKSFLVRIWLLYTVLMAVPALVLMGSGAVTMLGVANLLHINVLPVQPAIAPPALIASAITAGITFLSMSNCAFVLLPYSSDSSKPASTIVFKSIALTVRAALGLTMFSVISSCAINAFLAPVDVAVTFIPGLVNNDLTRYFLYLVKAVLHALFFAVILPLTVLVPCEIVRDNMD